MSSLLELECSVHVRLNWASSLEGTCGRPCGGKCQIRQFLVIFTLWNDDSLSSGDVSSDEAASVLFSKAKQEGTCRKVGHNTYNN